MQGSLDPCDSGGGAQDTIRPAESTVSIEDRPSRSVFPNAVCRSLSPGTRKVDQGGLCRSEADRARRIGGGVGGRIVGDDGSRAGSRDGGWMLALFLLDDFVRPAPLGRQQRERRRCNFRFSRGVAFGWRGGCCRDETLIGRLVPVWRQIKPRPANDRLSQVQARIACSFLWQRRVSTCCSPQPTSEAWQRLPALVSCSLKQ